MLETVLIIGLVVAMMVGPIMMLKPTKTQRRISKLRAQAESLGFTIRMIANPVAEYPKFVACYTLVYTVKDAVLRRLEPWRLLRQPYAHAMHYHGVWDWSNAAKTALLDEVRLKKVLDQLPPSVIGLESTQAGLGLLWLENSDDKKFPSSQSLDEMHPILAELKTDVERAIKPV